MVISGSSSSYGLTGGHWAGILGRLIDAEHMRYAGYSAIVDSRKTRGEIPGYCGWIHPGEPLLRKVILPIEINRQKLSYRLSFERKRKTQAASSTIKPIKTAS